MRIVKLPVTSSISQKCLTISIEFFKSRSWFFSRNLFKKCSHFILIGTTTPQKIVCKGIEPSVYEVNIDKKKNVTIYCRIFW